MFRHWAVFLEFESGKVYRAGSHRYFWTKRGAEHYARRANQLFSDTSMRVVVGPRKEV
jgi:hypothetical protein